MEQEMEVQMLAMIVKYIVTNEDDIRIQREEDEEN
jgi:predicted RNA-binding protein YlqC (UPF0109 family)